MAEPAPRTSTNLDALKGLVKPWRIRLSRALRNPVSQEESEAIDLRGNSEALFDLVDNLPQWRLRTIERIDYASTLLTKRTKLVHVRPLRSVLTEYVTETDAKVWVQLPVGFFPRKPFFEFDVEVAGVKTYRMGGNASFELLADYVAQLAWLIEDHDIRDRLENGHIFEWIWAICNFRTEEWQLARTEYKDMALLKYLQDGLCPRLPGGSIDATTLDEQVLAGWRDSVSGVSSIVNEYTLFSDENSAAENPLLALPLLKSSGVIQTVSDVPHLLEELTRFMGRVDRLSRFENQVLAAAASSFYSIYSLVGQYWMVLVECLLPLDESFMIEVSETRPVEMIYKQRWSRIIGSTFRLYRKDLGPLIVFDDAEVNHASVQVADPNVELGKGVEVRGRGKSGSDFSIAQVGATKQKGEVVLIYSGVSNRPCVVHLEMVIRPAAAIRAIHYTVALIVLFTAVSFLVAWHYVPGHFTATHVAWLLTPSTFATSLLLARESSALSGGLARNLRVLLATVLLLLWMLGFSLYLTDHLLLTDQKDSEPKTTKTEPARH